MNDRPFRHTLTPDRNEGLDVGTKSRRFRTGRFKQVAADVLHLGGYAITVVNGELRIEKADAP